jgi:hypothetical protein
MAVQKGRKVRVEVALTYATTKTVSEVTNANPGVASSTGHGLTAGTLGYFSTATGMASELEDGMAVSAEAVAADTFTLRGVDTTDWGNFTAGVFTPVATFATLSESTSYSISGGESSPLDKTTLLDEQGQEDTSILSPQRVQLDNFSNPQGAALAFVEACARTNAAAIFRITFQNGERRIWRGVPSVPGESLSVGQMATSGFSTTVRGRLLKLAVAA